MAEISDVDQLLDAKGLTCPLPLLKAKQAINKMASGEVLEVQCTDAGSVRDFQVFCEQSGHVLLQQTEADGEFAHWVRKA